MRRKRDGALLSFQASFFLNPPGVHSLIATTTCRPVLPVHRNVESITVITGTLASNTILFILPVWIYISLSPTGGWQHTMNVLFLVFSVAVGMCGLILHFVEQ